MHHHFIYQIPSISISEIIGILTLIVSCIAVSLAYRIGKEQIKLVDKQLKLMDKQTKISGIQTQINQLGLWTTRAENQRAISFNAAWKFKDSIDINEVRKANELVVEGNKITDMISKRDSETRDWIEKLNDVLNS